jgi:hypothetical protein
MHYSTEGKIQPKNHYQLQSEANGYNPNAAVNNRIGDDTGG